jgi:hypothetical protein
MPLEITSLSQSERLFLSEHMSPNPSPEQIQDLTARLLSIMIQDPAVRKAATNIVQKHANHLRDSYAAQEYARQHRYYQFGFKHSSSTPNRLVCGQWKVYEKDFAQFCRHFDLSEKSMLRVAAGEVDSYKDWCQGNQCGNLGTPRAKYLAEHNPYPAGVAVSAPYQGKAPAASQGRTFLMSEWWTPAE